MGNSVIISIILGLEVSFSLFKLVMSRLGVSLSCVKLSLGTVKSIFILLELISLLAEQVVSILGIVLRLLE